MLNISSLKNYSFCLGISDVNFFLSVLQVILEICNFCISVEFRFFKYFIFRLLNYSKIQKYLNIQVFIVDNCVNYCLIGQYVLTTNDEVTCSVFGTSTILLSGLGLEWGPLSLVTKLGNYLIETWQSDIREST